MKNIQNWTLRLEYNRLWPLFGLLFTIFYYAFIPPGHEVRPLFALFAFPRLVLAVFAGFASSYVLRSGGYFETLHETPRAIDFLLMIFAITLAEFVIALIFSAMTAHLQDEWLLVIVLPVPLFSVIFSTVHMILTRKVPWRRKRRITLRLQPDEATEFLQCLNMADALERVEIVPYSQALEELSREKRPNLDLIVFSRAGSKNMLSNRFILRAHVGGVEIKDRRDATAMLTKRIDLDEIDTWSFMAFAKKQTWFERFGRSLQIILEPIFALALLLLLSPLLLLLALIIRRTSPGPVFYGQVRTGHLGRLFTLYKFRSMRTDSEVNGYQWATKEDPRVTPVGRFLRKSRLDELPQLWNIARGEMSFIGPRPERPEIYADLIAKIPLFAMRTDVRPGVTGLAQVSSGYAASIEQSRVKLEHDLYYIQQRSLALDLLIILKTIKVVLLGSEFIVGPEMKKTREKPA